MPADMAASLAALYSEVQFMIAPSEQKQDQVPWQICMWYLSNLQVAAVEAGVVGFQLSLRDACSCPN